jgi:hypothetical protein
MLVEDVQTNRIAHINNTSGVPSIIAEEQRRQGFQTDVFVFNPITYKQFGENKFNYYSPISRWKFFKKLKDYNIWHYHHPYGSLRKSLEKRNRDKIYLKHYHGYELRGKYEDDFCLVSTPDLLQYAPNGKWIPNPINVNKIGLISRKYKEDNRIPKIAHYPHYKNYHSSDYYSDSLLRLEKERECEVVNIFHIPYMLALEAVADCDIVIGKILPDIGWFGKFELEAMALGKPVIAYVSDELYEQYKPPVYRTTKDTFKQDLESLLQDRGVRERLTREGLQYVKKYHSVEIIAKALEECYNTLCIT